MIKDPNNMEFSQKMQRCGKYIEALEEERRKIQVFQRELPLCLELVTQAIVACRRELSGTTTEYVYGQSECSEQTTGECGPVLEEFIPIKRTSSSEQEDDDDEVEDNEQQSHGLDEKFDDKSTKSDWLRSVQLWNQQSPDPPREEESPEKETAVEVKRNDIGAFRPYNNHHGEKSTSAGKSKSPAAATAEGDGGGRKKEAVEKEGGQRKQRRCWSQELHRRFLNALQHLGGPHVATPKQIRELMKVDGLTNDEVKSHLQKYRLHARRPSQTVPTNGNLQTPHLVVVRGIWVPQPDYSTADAVGATNAAPRIYGTAVAAPSPIAAPPQPWPSQSKFEPLIPEEISRCLHSDVGGVPCNSPAASSTARNRKKC